MTDHTKYNFKYGELYGAIISLQGYDHAMICVGSKQVVTDQRIEAMRNLFDEVGMHYSYDLLHDFIKAFSLSEYNEYERVGVLHEVEEALSRMVHAKQENVPSPKGNGWHNVNSWKSTHSVQRAITNKGMQDMNFEIVLHPCFTDARYTALFKCDLLEDIVEVRSRGFGAEYVGSEGEK